MCSLTANPDCGNDCKASRGPTERSCTLLTHGAPLSAVYSAVLGKYQQGG